MAGIRRVGQADLGEAAAGAGDGAGGAGDLGEEAVDEGAFDLGGGELGPEAAADELGAAAGDGDGRGFQRGIGEDALLGDAGGVGERGHLPAVDLLALGDELLPDDVGEGEVHVVAAEQDVIADGHAGQLQGAVLLERGDGREIGGAAADVDDQDDVADLDLLAPSVAVPLDPGVERGLRLLEQGDVLDARGGRGLDRQLARRGVERCRHGEHNLLLREGHVRIGLGEAVVPRLGEVLEVAPRGLDGGDLLDVLGRADGERGAAAVDAGVAEPALGAGDEAGGRLDAAGAGVLADGEAARRVPGQGLGALALVGDVEEGGQEGARLHGPLGDELRDGNDLGARAAIWRGGVGEGERGVGGAEVDPDDVARAHSSTSAGASTFASWPFTGTGSVSFTARQPRWRSTPR